MKCSIDNLENAIMEELQNYKQDVTDGIKADCKQVAKECKDDIKKNSPKRSGKYKKSWKTKVNHESREDIRITIYNGKHYRLTHLLIERANDHEEYPIKAQPGSMKNFLKGGGIYGG